MTPERVRREILSRFNPIRGLTPELLSRRLDAFRVGYLRELALTYDAMEARDINIQTVASKRKKAASRLDWDVLPVENAPKGKAEKHRAALKYFYEHLEATHVMESNQRGGVALLVRQMMDAIGKRYACHEIVWRPTSVATVSSAEGKGEEAVISSEAGEQEQEQGARARGAGALRTARPTSATSAEATLDGASAEARRAQALTAEFRFCPLWFFENRTGRLRFIPQAFGVDGVPMPDGDWLVTVGDGIMEACAVAYIYKQMSLKDWVVFSEKFGMPGVLGKTEAQKGSDQWNQLSDAIIALMNDWAAVTNKSDEITLLETKGGASNLPFPPLVEYMDRKIAAIWRGADLSTISHQGTGQGQGASLQGDEGDLLLEDDAQLISETLNEQVDRFVIEYLFGRGVEPLAYFKLGTGREEADDAEFRRKVWLGFLADGTVNDVMANLTDLQELTKGVGLPVNEEYIEPYLPVHDDNGQPVTGGEVRDSEGDIVGGTSDSTGANRGNGEPNGRNGSNGDGALRTGRPTNNGNGAALPNSRTRTRTKDEHDGHALENSTPEEVAAKLEENAFPDFAEAVMHDLRPIVDRLGRILDIQDPEIRRVRLASFIKELPLLKADILADPRAAHVMESTISAALLNGFSTKGPEAALK